MKNCSVNPKNPAAIAPNPDPSRWEIIRQYNLHGYFLLEIKYLDCTNYEGRKILLYKGKMNPLQKERDPHFSTWPNSPIARFKPDKDGWDNALLLALLLEKGIK